jgi:hypothetical protein
MRMRALIFLLVLAACGRPLSEAERVFMAEIQPGLQTERIRMVENPLIGLRVSTIAVRPRNTCRELILPPPTSATVQTRTAGAVLFQRVMIAPDYYLEDYLSGYPDRINLIAAMYFSHEMTHIWQWQNRDVTGYHPLRAAAEQWVSDDPYLFDPSEERTLLDYGYEQQASLVSEYVCCRTLDPGGARTERLERILSPLMDTPVASGQTSLMDVALPWAGADTDGICS